MTSVVSQALSKNPRRSVALILAPHLVSERVSNGHRGEMRQLDVTPILEMVGGCVALEMLLEFASALDQIYGSDDMLFKP